MSTALLKRRQNIRFDDIRTKRLLAKLKSSHNCNNPTKELLLKGKTQYS